MNIVITRYRKKTETIDGSLTIDGLYICDTAENAQSAVLSGEYNLKIVKCKQHARKMPLLVLHRDIVPSCDSCPKLDCVSHNTVMPVMCPMIKPGNGVYHRHDGSILLGTYIAPGCLVRPLKAFSEFYDRIRKSAERGHELSVRIVESY